MIPYEINVKEKTGFRNLVPSMPVIIFDEYARPFYDTSRLEKQVTEFNLPPGKYTVGEGQIREMKCPVNFELYPLPAPNRTKRKNPENFRVEIGDVPFKCFVDWDNDRIVYDRLVADMPLPTIMYIFHHECGHRYYGIPYKRKPWSDEYQNAYTYYEACCDRYAANKMIEAGYNPSQIAEAQIGTVTSDERNNVMVDTFLNRNYYQADGPRNFCDCTDEPFELPDNSRNFFDFKTTPTTDWTCADWVEWHKDLLKAYQDGRLAKYDYAKALAETNRVFAIHWDMSAGFSKQFWGKCGYDEGFFNYFRDIGYTDHISFLASVITPVLSGGASLAQGAGNIAGGAGSIVSSIGNNLFLYLSVGLLLYILIFRK